MLYLVFVVIFLSSFVNCHFNDVMAFVIGNYTPAGAVEVFETSDLDLQSVGV